MVTATKASATIVAGKTWRRKLKRRLLKPDPCRRDQKRERDFLGNLLRQPDLIYRINRAFRELAAGDLALLHGPLEAFGAMDLVNRDCSSLLQGLQLALKQDELPVLAWLQEHGDATQRETLQQLERETPASDLDNARTVMRQGFGADLPVVVKRADAVDWQRELLRTALRLRLRRLERERRELYYLLEDDDEGKEALHERIQLSVRAPQPDRYGAAESDFCKPAFDMTATQEKGAGMNPMPIGTRRASASLASGNAGEGGVRSEREEIESAVLRRLEDEDLQTGHLDPAGDPVRLYLKEIGPGEVA